MCRPVVFTPPHQLAQGGVGSVRDVNPARNGMDPSLVHLEVARGEAVERHRPVIRNIVFVQLAFD